MVAACDGGDGRDGRDGRALRVVSSTLAGGAIAQAVETLNPLGRVTACRLARRGFNHVYEFTLESGQRHVARLGSHRPRGAPNLAFETGLLIHLRAQGAEVAEPQTAIDGKAWAEVATAEGVRTLAVFRFLEGGLPGDSLPDIEAMGVGLAHIHGLSNSYAGPPIDPARFITELLMICVVRSS